MYTKRSLVTVWISTSIKNIIKIPFTVTIYLLSRLVHIECTRHRPIQICQSHEHMIPTWPDMQAILIQSGANGEENLLVHMRLAAPAKGSGGGRNEKCGLKRYMYHYIAIFNYIDTDRH